MAYPVTSPKQKTSGWRTKARPTHTGTDFGWYVGGVTYPRDVFAISDGTVKTGSESRAGNYVNLYSGNKRWLYGHLASISVRNGQAVKAGQKLGVMGQTGNAQGVHLHLSLYINGVESNPELHITNSPVKKEDSGVKIGSGDNWYNRLNKLHHQVRGRELGRPVFNSFVGQDTLRYIEILSDDKEADTVQNWQNVGKTAVNDKWDQQIYGLQDVVKAKDKELAALKKAIADDKIEDAKVLAKLAKLEAQSDKAEADAKEHEKVKSGFVDALLDIFNKFKI
jgi:hypothetical protein